MSWFAAQYHLGRLFFTTNDAFKLVPKACSTNIVNVEVDCIVQKAESPKEDG